MTDGVELVKTQVTNAVPEVEGFDLDVRVGPLMDYETGLTLPGRDGVYVALVPKTEALKQKVRNVLGGEAVRTYAVIDPDKVDEFRTDDKVKESVITYMLMSSGAWAKAKAIADAT